MESNFDMVVGTQYKVTRDNRNLPDPTTVRKRMVVQRAYVNQINDTLANDPNYLLRFDIDQKATLRFNQRNGNAPIPKIEELGYKPEPTKVVAAASTKPKTWNQVVKELKEATSIEELREIFEANPNFHDSKKVVETFESCLTKLAQHEG